MSIRNVVFDMGNVLIDYTPDIYARRFVESDQDAETLKKELFNREWALLDEGLTDYETALKTILPRLPERLHAPCRETMLRWHEKIVSRPEMTALVRELKERGMGVYLLSNAAVSFAQYKDALTALPYLNGWMVSAFEKTVKPKPEMFDKFLKRFDLKAEECLFVDDMPVNVRGAEACGLRGYCYEDGDYARLRATLGDLGCLG